MHGQMAATAYGPPE